ESDGAGGEVARGIMRQSQGLRHRRPAGRETARLRRFVGSETSAASRARAPRRPSNGRAGRDGRSPSRPRSPPSMRPPCAAMRACPPWAAHATAASRRDLLQQRVDAREAPLRALLDAVLHGGVSLLGRLEAHRLGQLRLLTEILELERLQVILERLHEARGWLDLAELTLDDAEAGSEPVGAAGTDVHLLDDGAVAPPFGDQLRICPDGVDVRARCVEDPLDADLELDGGGDSGAPGAR